MESVAIFLVGFILLTIPPFLVLKLLNHFEWVRALKGNTPWYKDVWKPISILALASLIKVFFSMI